jgi:flagellar L-ring protein precursor FlgH
MKRMKFCQFTAGLVLACLGSGVYADSLYSDKSYVGLVSDPRANRVGQALTILVYEQATAATSADRDTNESVSLSGQFDEVTGSDGQRNTDSFGQYRGQGGTRSEGGGTISRTGRLVASVSVTITDVAPSGELHIAGQQSIEFNEETQIIKIEGRIRPEDIAADNTVISTRLADARISYVGHGLLGRKQRPGFFSTIFGWIF